MSNIYKVWFTVLFLIMTISSKFIAVPFKQSYGYYLIPLSFGTPSIRRTYRLDLSIPFTWTSSYFYEPENSSTLQEKSISLFTLRDSSIQFYQCVDVIEIESDKNNITLPGFFFLYGKVSGLYYESIGLSFQFTDVKFSFIHYLFKKEIISHLSFTIIKNNFYEGIIYFGDTSNNITDNKYKGSCTVSDSYIQWGCSMNSVKIVNKEYSNNGYVMFNTYNDKLLAPYTFLQFMKENIFNQYIQDDACQERTSNNYSIYRCQRDKISNFPIITFKFNNNLNIIMYRNQTFDCIYLECVFQFTLSPNNTWNLGTSFISEYE